MIKVYLYTNQPILAMGLEMLLAEAGLSQLEYWSENLEEFLARLRTNPPDLVLVDHALDTALAAIRQIRNAVPQCKVLVWIESISTEQAFHAMNLGIRGLLRKSFPLEVTTQCLLQVHRGELWFEKALTQTMLAAKRVAFSPREGQVVALITQGLSNKEIASALRLTEGTVKVYMSRIFQRVGVESRFELALFGLQNRAAEQTSIPSLSPASRPDAAEYAAQRAFFI
jgi:two-component system nitrate/nitrite response regulator NarL